MEGSKKEDRASIPRDPKDVAPCVAAFSSFHEVCGVLCSRLRDELSTNKQVFDLLIDLLLANGVTADRINLAMSRYLQERNTVISPDPMDPVWACEYGDSHCCMLTEDQCACFNGAWQSGVECDPPPPP